jgi:hypothetical protein
MLKIKKNGIIAGGECYWFYNEETKRVEFKGEVKVKFGPITKKMPFNDSYPVKRELLLSSQVYQGQVIPLTNGGKIEILTKHDSYALAQVSGDDYAGVVEFDLGAELVDAVKVNIQANFSGLKAKIQAERV